MSTVNKAFRGHLTIQDILINKFQIQNELIKIMVNQDVYIAKDLFS